MMHLLTGKDGYSDAGFSPAGGSAQRGLKRLLGTNTFLGFWCASSVGNFLVRKKRY